MITKSDDQIWPKPVPGTIDNVVVVYIVHMHREIMTMKVGLVWQEYKLA